MGRLRRPARAGGSRFPPSPVDRLIQRPQIAFSFANRWTRSAVFARRPLRSPLYYCDRYYFDGRVRWRAWSGC